jgi:hypothetical protein
MCDPKDAGTRHVANGCSGMEHVSSRTPDDDRSDRSRRGALGWAAFLVIVMIVVAALIAGAVHGKLPSGGGPGVLPSLTGGPSPAPSPLPKPGPAPPATSAARIA